GREGAGQGLARPRVRSHLILGREGRRDLRLRRLPRAGLNSHRPAGPEQAWAAPGRGEPGQRRARAGLGNAGPARTPPIRLLPEVTRQNLPSVGRFWRVTRGYGC